MKKFTDFGQAFTYLKNHPDFQDNGESIFGVNMEIDTIKVNPTTLLPDNDKNLNTKTMVIIDVFTFSENFYKEEEESEYWGCIAESFEKAIIDLANILFKDQKIIKHKALQKQNQDGNIISLNSAKAKKQRGKIITGWKE